MSDINQKSLENIGTNIDLKKVEFLLNSYIKKYKNKKEISELIVFQSCENLLLNEEETDKFIELLNQNGFTLIDEPDDLINEDKVISYLEINKGKVGSAYSNYINTIKKYQLLTPQEELDLAKRAKEGDMKAREKLINSNLRLVISIAKRKNTNLKIMDLINYGNLGLIKAVDKFDYRKGFKFSTYATYWIDSTININSNQDLIRIPNNVGYYLYIIRNVQKDYFDRFYRLPTLEEIEKELVNKGINLSADDINKILQVDFRTISLESDSNENRDVLNYINDESVLSPIEFADNELKHEILMTAMDKYLSSREKEILIMRYGLNDSKKLTYQEIGDIYGICRERVRQIKNLAIHKLSPAKELIEPFIK